MKFRPPVVEIPTDDPFKNDALGPDRRKLGESLASVFKEIEDNLVVCLDAAWGEGKTTFVEMWQAHMRNEGACCLYFDAFKNDFVAEPFDAFVVEIEKAAKNLLQKEDYTGEVVSSFRESALRVASKVLTALPGFALRAAARKFLGEKTVEEVATLVESGAEALNMETERIFDSYRESASAIEQFEQSLRRLGEQIRMETGYPLVIIVDELDRCRPDFAMNLLERIKHFFHVPNVCFLISANLTQLESSVRSVYGLGSDAPNYLRKFFHVIVNFPKCTPLSHATRYIDVLQKYHGLPEHRSLHGMSFSRWLTVCLAAHFQLSLREIEFCMQELAMCFAGHREQSEYNEVLTPFLIIVRLHDRELFEKLKSGYPTFDEVQRRLGLDVLFQGVEGMNEHVPMSLKNVLQRILPPVVQRTDGSPRVREVEWLEATTPHGTDIKDFIRHLCRQIERFEVLR